MKTIDLNQEWIRLSSAWITQARTHTMPSRDGLLDQPMLAACGDVRGLAALDSGSLGFKKVPPFLFRHRMLARRGSQPDAQPSSASPDKSAYVRWADRKRRSRNRERRRPFG